MNKMYIDGVQSNKSHVSYQKLLKTQRVTTNHKLSKISLKTQKITTKVIKRLRFITFTKIHSRGDRNSDHYLG
jgi:hypothetical protein